jgi:hypothetical protein
MIEVDLGFDFQCLPHQNKKENSWSMSVSLDNVYSKKKNWTGKFDRVKMGVNLLSFKQITEVAWYFPFAGWHGTSPVEMYGALDTVCQLMERNGSNLPGND